MGIKGIYSEIGSGERISLCKLAVDHLESAGRPYRIAIDVSIWQFQAQSGKGGTNPVLRTFYYRLLRLLRLCIQPLFIFDGPNKPPFKRNKRTGQGIASLPDYMTKAMLQKFGFPYRTAPGEAEAECAVLQREGIVDAVLSEDVDTLMFGCTKLLRNWSSEGVRGNKTPTHVNVYDAEAIKRGKSGLDREGMVLVALMSGGDYIPAGVPTCGIKTACEAARAGFGHDLFKIPRKDTVAYNQWRERLNYELRINESGHFRTRHKSMQVPDKFPDRAVLYYYTNPVVSSSDQVNRYREEIRWRERVDIEGLRTFAAEAFGWECLPGAKHFIQNMATPMLCDLLRSREALHSTSDTTDTETGAEHSLITLICGRRTHFTTGGISELKVVYVPTDVVGLDISKEPLPDHTAIYAGDSEAEDMEGEGDLIIQTNPEKKRATPTYDPTQPVRDWIPETLVRNCMPLLVEAWDAAMKDPKKFASRKIREKTAISKKGTKQGMMDPFVKISKSGTIWTRQLSPPAARPICKTSDQPVSPTLPKSRPGRMTMRSNEDGLPKQRPTVRGKKQQNVSTAELKEPNLWTAAHSSSQRSDGSGTSKKAPAPLVCENLNSSNRTLTSSRNPRMARPDAILISSSPSEKKSPSPPLSVDEGFSRSAELEGSPRLPLFPISHNDRLPSRKRRPGKKLAGSQNGSIGVFEDPARGAPGKEGISVRLSPSSLYHSPSPRSSSRASSPSPRTLLRTLPKGNGVKGSVAALACAAPQLLAPGRNGQKAVLRDSLEGSWKLVGSEEPALSSRSFPSVEVVDLTCG